MDNPLKVAQPTKLPRLPKGSRISKRPLLHPPAAKLSRHASAPLPTTIYVSGRAPFASTTKRVRTALDSAAASRQQQQQQQGRGGEKPQVLVKATGKAIDQALRVALSFATQDGHRVRLGTASVGAVDDVVLVAEGAGEEETPETRLRRTSVLEVAIWLV